MIQQPLEINVDKVLRAKMPRYYCFVPRFIISWLERVVCQRELNAMLRKHADKTGVPFARAMLDEMQVEVEVRGAENLPTDGRNIFVSNHPMGGLDGLALISLLGERYNGNLRFIVNDILMAVTPLAPIFLPVNKVGRQSRERAMIMDNALNSDFQIATFPAGLCSRNTHGDVIEDLKWQKAFVVNAVATRRNVVPIYFDGQNSNFFYRLSKFRSKIGLKFNIEMIYLPNEMLKCRGRKFVVTIGKPIEWTTFDNSRSPIEWAAEVRKRVYSLK